MSELWPPDGYWMAVALVIRRPVITTWTWTGPKAVSTVPPLTTIGAGAGGFVGGGVRGLGGGGGGAGAAVVGAGRGATRWVLGGGAGTDVWWTGAIVRGGATAEVAAAGRGAGVLGGGAAAAGATDVVAGVVAAVGVPTVVGPDGSGRPLLGVPGGVRFVGDPLEGVAESGAEDGGPPGATAGPDVSGPTMTEPLGGEDEGSGPDETDPETT
ncbi:hypothetical protein [Nakamurella panacisegetis]|uniref:hypothetical protein n=1 Tax=Nakamurella panacisegetis TaxID=1090615 RepID=UPI001560A398|nr:hypothetical protein [Nakamurella panacisegetis]